MEDHIVYALEMPGQNKKLLVNRLRHTNRTCV